MNNALIHSCKKNRRDFKEPFGGSNMSDDFEVEVKKFEARFERFMDKEKDFTQALEKCVRELKEICSELNKMRAEASQSEQKIVELRLRVLKAFNNIFLKESEVEHEKSHLLESYGLLLLALEESFKLKQ